MSTYRSVISEDAQYRCGCGVVVDSLSDLYDHADEWHRSGADGKIYVPEGTQLITQENTEINNSLVRLF